MAIIQGTQGNDNILDTNSNDVIVGLDGNDAIHGIGTGDTIIEGNGNDLVVAVSATVLVGNGNDQFDFSGSNNTLYAGDGSDEVTLQLYSLHDRIDLGFGSHDVVMGGFAGSEYISAPGDYAIIDGIGSGDTIVLGGRHDRIIEREGNATGGSTHPDDIWRFVRTDKIVLHYVEPATWHQGPRGTLFVDGIAVAHVHGYHLSIHDLIFA